VPGRGQAGCRPALVHDLAGKHGGDASAGVEQGLLRVAGLAAGGHAGEDGQVTARPRGEHPPVGQPQRRCPASGGSVDQAPRQVAAGVPLRPCQPGERPQLAQQVEVRGRGQGVGAHGDRAAFEQVRRDWWRTCLQQRIGAGAQRDSSSGTAEQGAVTSVEMGAVSDVDVGTEAAECLEMSSG